MKKLLCVMLLSCFFLVGCGQSKYEQTMETYVKQYYEKHMSEITDLTIPKISIKDLEIGNEKGNDNFDLSKLKKCTKESYTNIIFKPNTREIDKFEHHLDCK